MDHVIVMNINQRKIPDCTKGEVEPQQTTLRKIKTTTITNSKNEQNKENFHSSVCLFVCFLS